ncbi:hypothetical protein VPHK406_0038 [Vibrio phage K406]
MIITSTKQRRGVLSVIQTLLVKTQRRDRL